jgi:hypothetical protein
MTSSLHGGEDLTLLLAYRPRPTQQGSSPQVGLPTGHAVPAGSQQQQPLQSVHVAVVALGPQTAEHAPPEDVPLELVELVEPLVDPPVVDPVPPPSPEEDGPVLPPLEQAASPAVADAPATTRT